LRPATISKASLGLDDAVLDIEVTPNRADFLSVIGVAREVAAASGVLFTLPPTQMAEDDEPAEGVATVEIADEDRCPLYLARILRDVGHARSPIRVQARLTAAGMRPISAAVDATNYAMLEIGQPLHPFDSRCSRAPASWCAGRRTARRWSRSTTWSARSPADDLMICDAERPVGVAGVMGGALAETSDTTDQILLEAASFERGGVQRTRRRIDLSTEASMRFERGVDPRRPRWARTGVPADDRLVRRPGAAGRHPAGAVPPRKQVTMRASRATKVVGYDVVAADATEVFDRLLMPWTSDGDDIDVEIPGYRVDIEREVDLIEEVVRSRGTTASARRCRRCVSRAACPRCTRSVIGCATPSRVRGSARYGCSRSRPMRTWS
jgi:phenylalanyl-tRNA synthetase beta chain